MTKAGLAGRTAPLSTLNYSQHCFKLQSCIKNCGVLKNLYFSRSYVIRITCCRIGSAAKCEVSDMHNEGAPAARNKMNAGLWYESRVCSTRKDLGTLLRFPARAIWSVCKAVLNGSACKLPLQNLRTASLLRTKNPIHCQEPLAKVVKYIGQHLYIT